MTTIMYVIPRSKFDKKKVKLGMGNYLVEVAIQDLSTSLQTYTLD